MAQALSESIPDARVEPLSVDLVRDGPRCSIALGLPTARALSALAGFNGARSTLLTRQRVFLVLVDDHEFAMLKQVAGDALSVASFIARVPFEPLAVDAEQARLALKKWLRDRYGRLNLQGFIRSEQEDTSFSIEDIYQDIRARPRDSIEPVASRDRPGRRPLHDVEDKLSALLEQSFSRLDRGSLLFDHKPLAPMCVVLGHPGSGKTFFLRWLALRGVQSIPSLQTSSSLPLLIPLAALQRTDLSLLEQIISFLLSEKQPAAHIVHTQAQEGRVLFLLDGLDEVGSLSQRAFVARAIEGLREQFPGCKVVVTSRIVGYADAPLQGEPFELAPLQDEQIRDFLTRWCELYAQELFGHDPQARAKGRLDGLQLARDVLDHPSLVELVRTPLLLTVLALVHRAGLRLPEHRIELYEHAFRVLVERWNQVRSLARSSAAAPVTMADALRLLGPVALSMIEQNERVLSQSRLAALLERILADNRLRGFRSPEEIIDLFKTNLGLLVEQGPDLFGFLHLTLAEYLASKELVRTRKLLPLVRDKHKLFRPEWREVVLLGAGDLGLIRADDVALDELVSSMVRSAEKGGRPTPNVPWLLAGFLADDPGLSSSSAQAIVRALIPGWWFEKKYTPRNLEEVILSAAVLFQDRLRTSRHRSLLIDGLRDAYGGGLPSSSISLWARSQALQIAVPLFSLLDIDWGPLLLQIARKTPKGKQLQWPASAKRIRKRWCIAFSSALLTLAPSERPVCRLLGQEDSGAGFDISPWDLPMMQTGRQLVLLEVSTNDSPPSLRFCIETEGTEDTFPSPLPSGVSSPEVDDGA